jgi:hypothetical protein
MKMNKLMLNFIEYISLAMITLLKPQILISDLNTIYQMLLNYPDTDLGVIKINAFRIKESLNEGKKFSDDLRKSEGTTVSSLLVVDDEIIVRLEQLYLKYKKDIGLKDSKDFLSIIIKLKNNKK